ncbi:MAG: hypothetical protein MJZ37_03785 [Bacilli bacterium]|nr:hypothetical protein [Bacilli bacterium]
MGNDLIYSLLGISFGFVICSSAVHHGRKLKFKKTVEKTEAKYNLFIIEIYSHLTKIKLGLTLGVKYEKL